MWSRIFCTVGKNVQFNVVLDGFHSISKDIVYLRCQQFVAGAYDVVVMI